MRSWWLLVIGLLAFVALDSAFGMAIGEAASGSDNDVDDNEDWLNYLEQNRLSKRKFAPSDPRSLFKAVYSNYGYRKRYSAPVTNPEDMYLSSIYSAKRGLRSPLDPRNLYRAVYGYRK